MLPAGCRANCTVWLESVVFVEPTMGVAEGIDENRARFGSHRAHRSGLLAFPLNDLTPSIGGRRRPGNDQDAIRSVFGHPFGKLNLQCRAADRDAPDGCTQVEVEGAGRRGARCGVDADSGYIGAGMSGDSLNALPSDRTLQMIRGRG